MHWLRKTTIKIPNIIADKLQNYESMKIGYSDNGIIQLRLVPLLGSGVHSIIATFDYPWMHSADYVAECKKIAEDEQLLVKSLKDYLRQHEGECAISYQTPRIVDLNAPELSELVHNYQGTLCGLQYWIETNQILITGPELPGIMGCRALNEPICYLTRGNYKHPIVSSRFDCKVYQRVLELV